MSDTGGDAEFRDFVASRSPALMRLAYLLAADAAAAEDLLQTALLRTYLRWMRIRHDPEAYVRRVLVTVAVDERRRPWRRERATAEVPEHPASEDPLTGVDEADRLRVALAATADHPGGTS